MLVQPLDTSLHARSFYTIVIISFNFFQIIIVITIIIIIIIICDRNTEQSRNCDRVLAIFMLYTYVAFAASDFGGGGGGYRGK